MGSYLDRPKNSSDLVITTINYSGILLSPFQFYSEQYKEYEAQLSKKFEELLKQQFEQYERDTFKWGLGKIDQKMQKQRYAPIYNQKVGIEKGQLIRPEQFEKMWQRTFSDNVPLIQNLEFKPEQRERAKIFDLICYKTIVFCVYKTRNFETINRKNIKPYQDFMKMFFSKSFLNENIKIQSTLAAIQKENVDIMFVQEANETLLKTMNEKLSQTFKIVGSYKGESVIFIRKNKFQKIHDEKEILQALGKEMLDALDWNHDTAIAFVDNLVLFSGHLSSKKQKNAEQVQKMLDSLEKMRKVYPNYHFIAGCDANSFIKTVPSFLRVYPDKENCSTVMKKRTMMQPQVNKADIVAKECRDHLITDLSMMNRRVLGIRGDNSENIGYLPCEKHPYDHFLVTAQVNINQ